jgi:hypothetical protein
MGNEKKVISILFLCLEIILNGKFMAICMVLIMAYVLHL